MGRSRLALCVAIDKAAEALKDLFALESARNSEPGREVDVLGLGEDAIIALILRSKVRYGSPVHGDTSTYHERPHGVYRKAGGDDAFDARNGRHLAYHCGTQRYWC